MIFWELLGDHTFRTVLLGTMGIGAVSGSVGCFAYLRRQSLVGDVVAHSSLLGIVLFFLISYWLTGEGSKSLFVLIPGAMLAGVLALGLSQWIVSRTSVRADSGLGVMLAIFFRHGDNVAALGAESEPAHSGKARIGRLPVWHGGIDDSGGLGHDRDRWRWLNRGHAAVVERVESIHV